MANRVDSLKSEDLVFSLEGDEVHEWEVVSINPKNVRFFIVTDKSNGNIKQVHWKTLEYGGDNVNFFSLTKVDLLNRFLNNSNHILDKIRKVS